MPLNFPVDFSSQAAQSAQSSAQGAPPKCIKASDLMKNYIYSALEVPDQLQELATGQGGHQTRKLKIIAPTQDWQIFYWDGQRIVGFSPPPASGTYVLGAISGSLSWISTEEC